MHLQLQLYFLEALRWAVSMLPWKMDFAEGARLARLLQRHFVDSHHLWLGQQGSTELPNQRVFFPPSKDCFGYLVFSLRYFG